MVKLINSTRIFLNLKTQNIFRIIFLSLFLPAIFVSCSSNGSLYNSDFPFSNKFAYSPDSSFGAAVPSGWYQVEDNECDCGNILLVRNDYQTSLNLIPFQTDDLSTGRIQKDPLAQLIKYSKIRTKQKQSDSIIIVEEESFKIDDIPVRSFAYLSEKNIKQRILVFQIKNRFFELIANSATANKDILIDLFNAQNSLVGRIKSFSRL